MSTSPRWKTAVENALAEYKNQTVFSLASLDNETGLPHVRSMIFRTFIQAQKFPVFPLIVATTDIRTPKVSQLAKRDDIELSWWIEGTQEQFRISGKASVIGPALVEPNTSNGPVFNALREEKFDWESKRREVFKTMSGHMKATWCRPIPGSPLEDPKEAQNWPKKLEEPKDGNPDTIRNWNIALGNFALLVIDPDEVEFLELGVVPNRRTKFRKHNEKWGEEPVVP